MELCRIFVVISHFWKHAKKRSPRTIAVLGLRVVETTGLEPVTSCV